MDNTPIDDGVFSPSNLFPTEALDNPLSTNGGLEPHTTPLIPDPNLSGVTNVLGQAGGALGSLGVDVLKMIPGVAAVEALIGVVIKIVGDVDSVVKDAESAHPLKAVESLLQHLPDVASFIGGDFDHVYKWMADHSFGAMFKSILNEGLGVDTSKFTGEENAAVSTIDTMLGWAFGIQFIVAALETSGSGIFANRWAKALKDTIAQLPQDMGVSWALGLTIDESFKAAQGVILTEAINKQKRPNRVEWPQTRLMLKQHVIDQARYEELLKAQGFPDDQIENLRKLVDVSIPVGDIGQLYLREKISEGDAQKLIEQLGFSPEQAGWLVDLYVTKAENEASVTYRTIAKQLFENNLIAEGQYRTILTEANYPTRMINQDIAGISLMHKAGRLLHAVGEIKTRYQHGQINAATAMQELGEINYAPSFQRELIQAWDTGPTRKGRSISQAKVLSYYMSGILTRADTETRLRAMGLPDGDVSLLLDHPSASQGARQHARTPGLVVTAYADGIIPPSSLEAALTASGVKADDMAMWVGIAHYRLAHHKGVKGANVPLSAGDYKAAYKNGLIDFQTLVSDLETLGYNPDDAMLIAEVENKGPYKPPTKPPFATVADAVAYLESAGFKLSPPPDPTLLAAEAMAASAGYTWVPPPAPPPATIPPAGANP